MSEGEPITEFDRHKLDLLKRFLDLGPDDDDCLEAIGDEAVASAAEFVEYIYPHFGEIEPLRALLNGPQQIERLKQSQIRYYRQLFSANHDDAYILERLRVGAAHHRVGLDAEWYLATYALFLNHFIDQVIRRYLHTPELACRILRATLKQVFFDIGLVLESYAQADRRHLLALKDHAEHILDNMPCALAVLDPELRVHTVNHKFAEMFGRSPQALSGLPLDGLLELPELKEWGTRVLQTRMGQYGHHFELKTASGTYCLDLNIAPVDLTEVEGRRGLIATLEDHTEEESLRRHAEQQASRLMAIMQSVPDGIITFDQAGSIQEANPAAERIFARPRGDLAGAALLDFLCDPWCRSITVDGLIRRASQTVNGQRLELLGRRDGEASLTLEIAIQRVGATDPPMFLAVLRDITEKKEAELRLCSLANYDQLTGLPNRALYLDRLETAIARAKRHGQQVGVFFLDLDDFKKINDSMGHFAGDALLQQVAARLLGAIRDADTAARFGGDEFTFVIGELDGPESCDKVARKLLDVFREPIALGGHEVFVSASIGVALFPTHAGDPQTLLKFADAAMYQAKAKGRNSHCIYNAALFSGATQKLTLESKLHNALNLGEFSLVYQPQVDLKTGGLHGVEALLRWTNPELGSVPPDRFIPLLEETGLILPVGEWALRAACRQAVAWIAERGLNITMAVNASSLQFQESGFAHVVDDILRETGLPADRLELEITETTLFEHNDTTLANLTKLTELGVKLAVDDFGTGYSSLSYLRSFPWHTIKIDRSFIQGLHTARDSAIARAIVLLGHSLDMRVVAEGIEKPQHLALMRAIDCDISQGYLFSRPETPERLTELFVDRAGTVVDLDALTRGPPQP
jgi:diguanylate cyclase (GGDEF)-like protein/PAS domain S-box-containing protein